MGKDFFDTDLTRGAKRTESPMGEDGLPLRQISDINLTQMARQKEQLAGQVADHAKEIEQLRMREDSLQKERRELEGMRQKQLDYEGGKKDIIEKVERGIILLEKEERQAAHTAELLAVIRGRFRDALGGLKNINEEAWAPADFQAELNKASVLVEDAKAIYSKAVSTADAVRWNQASEGSKESASFERRGGEWSADRPIQYWIKLGLAFSLPLMGFLLILFILWVIATGAFFSPRNM